MMGPPPASFGMWSVASVTEPQTVSCASVAHPFSGHVPVFLIRKLSVTPQPWPALCLAVESVDDADRVGPTWGSDNNAILEVADPSGNLIELVTT